MANPFAHIELSTGDVSAAKKFYKRVFDWKLSDMPQMGYTLIDVGKGTGGGMQGKMSPDQPTGWLPYVEVDDVKKSMAKATKAGATAVMAYQEIGEMGAIGIFTDPTGATIGIWAAAKKPAKKAPAKKAAKKAAKKKK